jgi:CelD/BcsL family acetyltransferase involved in cellulose biosynthesis
LCAVAVRAGGGALVGLAPFYVEESAEGRRLLPLGISISDYLDVLLRPDLAEAAGGALARCLARETWESWELPELRAGAAAWHIPCPRQCRCVDADSSVCTTLTLPGGAMMPALPPGKRGKIRLARNRAARMGAVAFASADTGNLAVLLDALLRLHGARWASRGEAGVLADERVVRFHRAAAPRLLAADLLRLHALRIGGHPAAVFYGFHHRGRSYAYLTGFDPALAFASPGTLIVAHAIEAAAREGAREVDFLRGEEDYKRLWGAVPRRNAGRRFARIAADAVV